MNSSFYFADVPSEAEGDLDLLLDAEGGAVRQLRQLRRLPPLRRRRPRQRTQHIRQAPPLHTAVRSPRECMTLLFLLDLNLEIL